MPKQLYRAVKTLSPTRNDFMSAAEMGKEPVSDDPEVLRTHDGISTFTPWARAAQMATRYRKLGAFLAELQIPDNLPGVRCERTFLRSEGHYTVWGDADVLMTLVVGVYPVSASAKEDQ